MSLPNILAIIPVRYHSTRFPRKALVDIGGKSMVQRVYEQAKKSQFLKKVIVATDDERIADHVQKFDGEVILTGEHHNGTSRCWEAAKKSGVIADFVLNIQGDEPFIQPEQIDQLCNGLTMDVKIASMAKRIRDERTLLDPNCVKVVLNKNKEALYFSRATIPHVRSIDKEKWIGEITFYKHIGLYAYQYHTLSQLVKLPKTELEQAENLEQLRWIYHGFKIQMIVTKLESIGIDRPEDVDKAIRSL